MIEFAAGIMLGGSLGAVIMGALVGQARESGSRDLDPTPFRSVAARPDRRGIISRAAEDRLIAASDPRAIVFATGAIAGAPYRGRLQ
jgi:hypothetical protein